MRLLIIFFCLIFFLASNFLKAQKDTSYLNPDYVSSFYGKLGIYAYGISKYSTFEFNDTENRKSLAYKPNENLNFGLGLNYKWMGIGLAFNFGAINNDNDLYGKTQSLDLQVDLYSKKWVWSGNFQVYSGYYWSNPDKFFNNWSIKDSVVIRPDIVTFNFGFGGIYTVNSEKFSLKSAFVNTEWQKKSAGSLLIGGFMSLYAMSASSSLVPVQLYSEYPNSVDMASVSSLNLGSAVGYAYTLVIRKHFYINLALMLGLNLQGVSAFDLEGEELGHDNHISSNFHSRFAIGYNHEKYYFGLSAASDGFLLRNPNDTEFSYGYGKVRFFYGRRFTL